MRDPRIDEIKEQFEEWWESEEGRKFRLVARLGDQKLLAYMAFLHGQCCASSAVAAVWQGSAAIKKAAQ